MNLQIQWGAQACKGEKSLYSSTFQSDVRPWFWGKITPFSTFDLQIEMDFIFDIFIPNVREPFLSGLAGVNEMVFFITVNTWKPYVK